MFFKLPHLLLLFLPLISQAKPFENSFSRFKAYQLIENAIDLQGEELSPEIENKNEVIERFLDITEKSDHSFGDLFEKALICVQAQVSLFLNTEQGICFRLKEKEFYRIHQARIIQVNDFQEKILNKNHVHFKAVLRADLVFFSGFPDVKPNFVFSCWRAEVSSGVGGNAFVCLDVTNMATQPWKNETTLERVRDILEQVLPVYLFNALLSKLKEHKVSLIGAGLTLGVAYEGLGQNPTLRLSPLEKSKGGKWILKNFFKLR